MLVKTILNRLERHRGFVYGRIRMLEELGRLFIEAEVRPRVNSRPACSGCKRQGPGYDTLKPRRFEFVPLCLSGSSSCMPCEGWTAWIAGCAWRWSLGPRARTT